MVQILSLTTLEMCRGRDRKNQVHLRRAIGETKTLQASQKKILEERYLPLLEEFEGRAFFYAILFHTCRFIVTVGSLIVPALLSIQYVDTGSSTNQNNPEDFTFQIYWTTWVISLLVTTSNGIFTLFKVDKRYYLLHTMLEQLRSEGWQYLELSGRFSGFYTPKEIPTHENQFLYFCHAVEKLKMKQVEEEYYKSTESNLHGSTTNHANGAVTNQIKEVDLEAGKVTKQVPAFFTDGLIPPTPLNPQLQQLLQALTVDGGGTNANLGGKTFKEANLPTPIQEASTEMPVRPEMHGGSPSKERILRQTSKGVSETESAVRMGAEIPAQSVEQKSQVEENA